MKKFTKIMLSVAAVTAVSTAMAISAMAEDTITGKYDPATGIVTLTGTPEIDGDMTLLVLTEDTTVTSDNTNIIAQIDQAAEIPSFQLEKDLTEGTYYIRMGGDGHVYTGTFTIGGEEPGGDEDTITIIIGDIDQSEDVSISDVTALARGNAGKKRSNYKNEWVGDTYKVVSVTEGKFEGETVIIGDIDQSDDVSISDVTALARGNAGKIRSNYKNECVGATVVVSPVTE